MNDIKQMAQTAGVSYNEELLFFARLLVAKCAQIATANDDLFTMRDILEWYEANE